MSLAYDMIVWDWNGTLLDDAEFGLGIINTMLRKRGIREKSRDEHARLFDFPVIRYYERIGFDMEREPFEKLSHEFIDTYYAGVKSCSLQAGSIDLLDELQRLGCRQVVLSASRQDYLEDQVRHYGLEKYFEELLGIDSVHAPGKTGRGRDWIRDNDFNRDRLLMIGDTVHDAEVASEMGIPCWLVYGGHHPEDRLKETGNRCFHDLRSLGDVMMQRAEGIEV